MNDIRSVAHFVYISQWRRYSLFEFFCFFRRSNSEGKDSFMRGFEIPNFVFQLLVECPGISETKVSMIEKQLEITKSTQPYSIDSHASRLRHDLQDWIMKHGREATLEKLFEAFWKAEIWGYMKNRLLDVTT